MTLYINNGDIVDIIPNERLDARPKLEVGTYTIMFSMDKGFFLQKVADVELNHKVYGEAHKISDRILHTFKDRPNNTGVLLSGEKGSGKTVLAKMISRKGLEQGLVTIYVSQPYTGESFNRFLANINQPIVVIFDEFEKVYSKPADQEALLSLFDGLYPSKKLFVVTINETNKLSNFMLNRPGRFFYHLKYKGLTPEEVQEFAEDRLVDKTRVEEVVRLTKKLNGLSYDVLNAMIEEINRYNEVPKDAIKMLNIDITPRNGNYKIVELISKKTGNPMYLVSRNYNGIPGVWEMHMVAWESKEMHDKEIDEDTYDKFCEHVRFDPSDLIEYDEHRLVLENEDHRIVLHEKANRPDFRDFILK